MKKKKYFAPEITVIEMESSQIMAGSSGSANSPSSPGLPDTGTRGWTPDGDPSHGFGIVEENDKDYSDEDF